MKSKQNLKKKWTTKDIVILEKYVATNSLQLVSNFYKNILVGYIRFGKPYEFFTKLSQKLGKSKAQCKTKFYKMENELYVEVLTVAPLDFCLFVNIRRQNRKKIHNKINFQNKKGADNFSKKGESGSLIEFLNKKQKASKLKQSTPTKEGLFYQMSDEEIKHRRLKMMQLYLEKKLDFPFRNAGETEFLTTAEKNYVNKLVKKTIQENSHNLSHDKIIESQNGGKSECEDGQNKSDSCQRREYLIPEKGPSLWFSLMFLLRNNWKEN